MVFCIDSKVNSNLFGEVCLPSKRLAVVIFLTNTFLIPLISANLVAAEKLKVSFDDHGRMIVNGKVEFPLGIYTAIAPGSLASDPEKTLAMLDDLQNSPFDILVNYAGPAGTLAQKRKYLDALAQRGLREMFSVKDYYAKGVWGESPYLRGRTEEEAIRQDVKPLKDHPAILGWYLSDEETDYAAVGRFHKWAKQEDPDHMTLSLVNLPWAHQIAPFLDASDVLCIDTYPVGNGGVLTDVARHTDELVKVTKGVRPAWFVPQAYGGYMCRNDFRDITPEVQLSPSDIRTKGRAPTPREMRCISYLALTHGATGLIYYYYKDIKMAYDSESRWAAVKDMGREIKSLSPVLLAEDFNQGLITSDNPQIHWKAKHFEDKTFLIAVNSTTDTQTVMFNLPIDVKNTTVRAGAGLAYAKDRELLLIMDGYEALTVEIEGAVVATKPQKANKKTGRSVGRGGHWRFEEDGGDKVLDSGKGPARNGQIDGKINHSKTTFAVRVPGLNLANKGSMEFSGIDGDSLIVDDIDGLDVAEDDFTLEAWIYPRSIPGHASLIAGKGITGNFADKGYELGLRTSYISGDAKYTIYFDGSVLAFSLRSGELAFNQWRHVAVNRKGGDINLYVDGVPIAKTGCPPTATFASRQRFSIGCSALEGPGKPGRPFDGFIDEVRLTIGEALGPSSFLYNR
jgi:hypothetical protein